MFTDAAGLALAVRQMRFQLLRRDVKVGIQQLPEKLMRFQLLRHGTPASAIEHNGDPAVPDDHSHLR